jgi:hypothetical protein
MVRRSHFLRSLLALAAGGLLSSTLLAADAWPSKPIRLVVPYPPGGSSDIIARSIGQLISQELKQTVVIDNKPGANGNLGAEFVARAPADGYTWLLCDLGALAISPRSIPSSASILPRRCAVRPCWPIRPICWWCTPPSRPAISRSWWSCPRSRT